jgi:predicted RNA-binding Zn-ribbon protein involved in translation (DUF1610 family)
MQTNKTTGCKDCGEQCQGTRCQRCGQIHAQENRDPSFITYECPECGGTTSGKGVTCFKCRGEN